MLPDSSKILQILAQKTPEKKYNYSYSIKPTNFLILSEEKKQRKLDDFFSLLESTDKEVLITLTRNPITVHYKNKDTEMEVLEILLDSYEPLDNALHQIGFNFSRDEIHPRLTSSSEGISDFVTYVNDEKILGKAYTLERMPSMLPDAWIHRLFTAFHQMQITINPIPAEKAMKIAKNKKAIYSQIKSQGSKDEKRIDDILKLVDQIELGLTQLFSFTINGFVFAEDYKQLRTLDKSARKKLSSLNTIMIDSYGQQTNIVNGGGISWFGTTESTAIFYPFTSSVMLEIPNGFVLGASKDGSPVIYDPKYRKNHNIFTCGAQGSGKSFGEKIMLKQFRTKHPKSMCVVIDPQEEYLPHAEYFGLKGVKIIPGKEYGLNPFDLFENESEVIDILASFTGADDVIVNEWRSKCQGIKSIRELYDITEDEQGKKYLIDLVEGPVSKIFEGENKFSDQMIISLKDTENTKTEKLLILLVLTWAWKRMIQLPDTQWKYLLLDEAWRMTKLKLSGQKIAEIARQIRKKSGIFAVCTQLFSDLDSVLDSQSKVTDLFDTKIIMNSAPTAAKEIGEALDLQPIEVDRIENFKKGETVLFTSDNTIYFKFEADEKETTVYFNTDADKE